MIMVERELMLSALVDDGNLIISRQDGQPIDIMAREDFDGSCIQVLEINDTGNAVKALQALLNVHCQHLDVDGIFGPATQTALIIFHDSKGINCTGTCDAQTWAYLIKE